MGRSEDIRLREDDLNNCCDVCRNVPDGSSPYLELPDRELGHARLPRVHDNFHESAGE